jgi:hypothetical protein
VIERQTRIAPKRRPKGIVILSLAIALGGLSACQSKVLKAENSQEILKNEEFENKIQIEQLPPAEAAQGDPSGTYVRLPGPEPVPGAWPAPVKKGKAAGKNANKPQVGRASAKTATVAPQAAATPIVHEPAIEDGEGFVGRRPQSDPYRVGEKVTLEASYFGVVAGDMTLETRPFVQVNGRKSYNFVGTAISTSVFAMFYAVDDWFETQVDYETMIPYSYALHVKESKQLRETRSIFDWSKGRAFWWDKKIDSEKKVEENRKEWDLPPYSQNIFSAAYYLRSFQLRPGKKIAFRVAHENENLVVTAEVLRRERISTPAGEFNTVVIKPKIELNGVFKPVGDIFMWLTDDERKFIIRIESKIKIGTIVAVAKKVDPGPLP